jgi:hypothetical protein
MGFKDDFDAFNPFTPNRHRLARERKEEEEELTLNALRRQDAAAVREEENLLRRQQAMPALMNRLNTSRAMLPEGERTIENSIFSDRNTSTNELLGRVDPEAAMKQSMAVAYPQGYTGTLKPRERAYVGGEVVAEGMPEETVFKPLKMRIPGTDRIVMARTPEEYDANIEAGFVDDSGAVPGAPSAADKKLGPNDYMEDPSNPNARVMVRGGSAAVARAEALARPVLDERKVYNEAANQYATMADLSNDESGASDISLVYGFFKANDPISSVREGEFATAGEKLGLPTKIIGEIKSLTSGKGFLTQEARLALLDTAGRAIKQRKKGLQRTYRDASKGFEGLGVDRRAFIPFSVEDVNLDEVRKQFPEAKEDTAGRVYVIRNGKRAYVELDE